MTEIVIYNKWFKCEEDFTQATILNALKDAINSPVSNKGKQLIEALEQYNNLLTDELNELVSITANNGWKSSRVAIGEQLRNKIAELNRQLPQY